MQDIQEMIKKFKYWEWDRYKKRKRKKLKNHDFTILASNCCGTIMYHDLGLFFTSPTINLSMGMDDFVRLVGNLEWYMKLPLSDAGREGKYPTGMLGDVKICFMHYKTFEEAAWKWEERKKRINWDNVFVVGTDKDGCTRETMQHFEELPYKNKVLFSHLPHPEFPSVHYIKGFEEKSELGVIINFKEKFLMRRYMDDFDYVTFLNGEMCK